MYSHIEQMKLKSCLVEWAREAKEGGGEEKEELIHLIWFKAQGIELEPRAVNVTLGACQNSR
jgi:hypothetical protein